MQFRSNSNNQDAEVNLTPLIDVVFLLLIFFMVSTTFDTTSQLKINLPEAEAHPLKNLKNKLEITINAKGDFYLNGHQVANRGSSALMASIQRQIKNGDKNSQVMIQSDALTPVQSLVTALDVVSRLGLNNLSIATTQQISK